MKQRRIKFNLNKLIDLIADWQAEQPKAASRKLDFHEEIRGYMDDVGAGEIDWLKRALQSGLATPEKIKVLESYFQREPGFLLFDSSESAAPSDLLSSILHSGSWSLPKQWPADSWLLRSEYALVPFHNARAPELNHLSNWCAEDTLHGIYLIHGRGGVGKTRLASELVGRLKQKGWTAGFLINGCGNNLSSYLTNNRIPQSPLCLVVDYAEQRVEEFVPIFEALSQSELHKTRLILLARAKAEWWQATCSKSSQAQLYVAQHTRYLPLKFPDDPSARQTLLTSSCAAFAGLLDLPTPQTSKLDLSSSEFAIPLLISIAGLSIVRGKFFEKGDDLIGDLIIRERRVWDRRAISAGLRAEVVGPVIAQGVALATLIGGCNSEYELLNEISTVPLAQGMSKAVLRLLVQIIAENYPEPGSLGALRPDIVGEHLVDIELSKEPTLYARSLNSGN